MILFSSINSCNFQNCCIIISHHSVKLECHHFAVTAPTITRTNLNKGHSVMTQLKENLTLFCESQGKPEPSTVWFKVSTYSSIWGGADKSLALHTSQCRRMESIVSLERGVCSCAELQVFSCYRDWKEACQATHAISTTWRRQLSSNFFFSASQGAEWNSRHSDINSRRTCTIICHHQKLGDPE